MKNFLMQQRGRTCLNIVWIIVNVLLYTGTSVLLTFTTDAVFSKNLLALVEWSVVNLLVWMTFLVSNYFQTVFQEKLTQRILVAAVPFRGKSPVNPTNNIIGRQRENIFQNT